MRTVLRASITVTRGAITLQLPAQEYNGRPCYYNSAAINYCN
ncbi:hypothetical protein [Chitinophaga sp. HK235]|nr:hypothetical protein [Chitinophaga sp. HK235]